MESLSIRDIEFETATKHLKGKDTEDSALRIIASVCKSLKIDLLQRVVPPREYRVGECDAIMFTDIGLILVEVKRIGGNILDLDTQREKITVEKGDDVVNVSNPALAVMRKAQALSDAIQHLEEWRRLNFLFKIARISDHLPVYRLLCFGPSTDYDESEINPDTVLVANTRNLRGRLEWFIEGKQRVIGVYRHSKLVAHNWGIQGILKVQRKAGFIRAFPSKAFGEIVSFVDCLSVQGKKTGLVSLHYRDRVAKSSKAIERVVFRIRLNNEWTDVHIDAKTEFSWKAGG